jgi:hypothetical protein
MNTHDEDRTKQLLRQALPPMRDAEPARDLWPAMRRRLNASAAASPLWFDWALAGGLVAFAAFAPSAIPVFLYYL